MMKQKNPKGARHPLSALEPPILQPLATRMMVDIVVNEKSQVWLLHDLPFAEIVKWAEYDLDYNKVILVMLSGRQQELGIVIPTEMRDYLQHGRQIYIVQMQGTTITDFSIVPLMTHGDVYH
jgi:hypothetical protein